MNPIKISKIFAGIIISSVFTSAFTSLFTVANAQTMSVTKEIEINNRGDYNTICNPQQIKFTIKTDGINDGLYSYQTIARQYNKKLEKFEVFSNISSNGYTEAIRNNNRFYVNIKDGEIVNQRYNRINYNLSGFTTNDNIIVLNDKLDNTYDKEDIVNPPDGTINNGSNRQGNDEADFGTTIQYTVHLFKQGDFTTPIATGHWIGYMSCNIKDKNDLNNKVKYIGSDPSLINDKNRSPSDKPNAAPQNPNNANANISSVPTTGTFTLGLMGILIASMGAYSARRKNKNKNT